MVADNNGSLLRSFIAIPLPEAQQRNVATLQQQLRQMAPELTATRPESLHLTLHFLADQPKELLAKVGRSMLSIGEKKKDFNVTLKGLDCFPNRRRPRILWLGLEPQNELIELHRQLATMLQKFGLPSETRPFRPHLTIGRFKSPPKNIDWLCPFLTHSCGSFTIDTMILFRSELSNRGALHTPLTTAPLGAVKN